jgi:DNA invertase Pin-like site-specific DNA recombinase
MRRGYAHEVGEEEDLDAQAAMLAAYGCDEVLVERETGEPARLRLDEYLYNLRAGDELVVVGFEAFARTTGKLVVILDGLLERGVSVTALSPSPVTLDADRRFSAHELMQVLARHEAVRMHQRFHTGEGGARNARRYRLDDARTAEALGRFQAGESIASIARDFGVDRRIVNAALSGRRIRGEQIDRDGRVRVRRTLLNAPAFDILRTTRSGGNDGDGA